MFDLLSNMFMLYQATSSIICFKAVFVSLQPNKSKLLSNTFSL